MKSKFEIKSGDKVYYLKRPTSDVLSSARAFSSKTFNEAVKRGDFFRAALDKVMREQGLWDDDKEEEIKRLEKSLAENDRKLAKGGISKKKAEEIAIRMRRDRVRRLSLLATYRRYDSNTVEGQQENSEFDYLVANSLVNEEDELVFKSVEEYRQCNDDYAVEAAQLMSEIHYGLNRNWQHDLPENKLLKKFGKVDDQLRLVDGSGNFVTTEGRRIDEFGRYLNDDGEFVDEDGNRVDENGLPIEEFSPFLDDDGNPITE